MVTQSYIFPASGLGFARSSCLATFASGVSEVSGSGYLSLGDYEEGFAYYFDGESIIPVQGTNSSIGIPSPVLFGDWVYFILGGQLPTMQLAGGIEFVGGAYGGISWTNLAYTGTHGLQVQTNFGGVLGFDSAIPDLGYLVTGTELFSVQYQVLDSVLPQQIELQLYESSLGWHKVYVGIDQFELGGFNAGPVAPVLNDWVQITFTPTDVGLTPGMMITGVAWGVYNSTSKSSVVFSDTSDLNQPNVTIQGFVDSCQDNNVGFYILGHVGPLFRIPAIGAGPLIIPLSTNPSFDYTGMCFNPTDQVPYFIGYDGTIYKYTSSVITVAPSPSGIATVPARQLFSDGSNLYTLFGNSNSIGKYDIGGDTWRLISSPFTVGTDTFHYSNSLSTLVVGGSNYSSLDNVNTITGMSFLNEFSQLFTCDSSNNINIYNNNGEGFIEWSLAQQIPGTGNPIFISADQNTEDIFFQVLVADTVNNVIQVLTVNGGVWYDTQHVAVNAPTSITTFVGQVDQALICQPSLNTVTILNESAGNWAISQILSIPSPTSISITNNLNNNPIGIITTATGVTFIEYNGANWSILNSINLTSPGPVPTLSSYDFVNTKNTYLYAAGTSGGNSVVYVFQTGASSGALAAQYPIIGTISSLGIINFQVVSPLTSGSLDVGTVVSSVVSHGIVSGVSVPINSDLMTWVTPELGFLPLLLIAGPNNIWSFYNDQPKSIVRASDSLVAILSGGAWTNLDLKEDNKVASITTDPSGNIFAMLTDNTLYKYNSLGVLASGYPYTLVPPINQEDGVPLGFSKMLYWNGILIASSSLMGGITVITP